MSAGAQPPAVLVGSAPAPTPAPPEAEDEYYYGSYYDDEIAVDTTAAGAVAAAPTLAPAAPAAGTPHADGGESYYGSYYSEEAGAPAAAPGAERLSEYSYYSEPEEADEEELQACSGPARLRARPVSHVRCFLGRWRTTSRQGTSTITIPMLETLRGLRRPEVNARKWLDGGAKEPSLLSA